MGLYEEHKKIEPQYIEANNEWAKQQMAALQKENAKVPLDITMNWIIPAIAAIGGELVGGPLGAIGAAGGAKGLVEKYYHDKPFGESAKEGAKEAAITGLTLGAAKFVGPIKDVVLNKATKTLLKTPADEAMGPLIVKTVKDMPSTEIQISPEAYNWAVKQQMNLARKTAGKTVMAGALTRDASQFVKSINSATTKHLDWIRGFKDKINKLIPETFTSPVEASLSPTVQKEARTKLLSYEKNLDEIEKFIADSKRFDVPVPPDLESGVISARQAISDAKENMFKNIVVKKPSGITERITQAGKTSIQRSLINPMEQVKRLVNAGTGGFVGGIPTGSSPEGMDNYMKRQQTAKSLSEIMRGAR